MGTTLSGLYFLKIFPCLERQFYRKLFETLNRNDDAIVVNDFNYSRVWTERSTNNVERNLIEMEPPETSVIASSVQVPDVETLGQSQPCGEVLGVLHGDEEHRGLVA